MKKKKRKDRKDLSFLIPVFSFSLTGAGIYKLIEKDPTGIYLIGLATALPLPFTLSTFYKAKKIKKEFEDAKKDLEKLIQKIKYVEKTTLETTINSLINQTEFLQKLIGYYPKPFSNPYQILGVEEMETKESIKKAYLNKITFILLTKKENKKENILKEIIDTTVAYLQLTDWNAFKKLIKINN